MLGDSSQGKMLSRKVLDGNPGEPNTQMTKHEEQPKHLEDHDLSGIHFLGEPEEESKVLATSF